MLTCNVALRASGLFKHRALQSTDTWPTALSWKFSNPTARNLAQSRCADMGVRVANMSGRLIDFIELDDGFALAKIHAPSATHNRTLEESTVRTKYRITIVGIKRTNQDFQHATPSTLILPGDLLIVSGPTGQIQRFAGQAE
jgi:K+/H+ antiporter YhaU regulatory subunit KhtT